jgi:uncharacterized protein
MPEVTTITLNQPTWVDLASPDIEASKRFYGQLFGWEVEQVGGPEMGNYSFFKKGGKQVAGAGSTMDADQFPAWTMYIASKNADEMAEKIKAAGGEIAFGPMDVPNAGRMCVFKDTTGAFAALWQAGNHTGAQLWGEAGSVGWVELQTRDIGKARQFYQQVFDWKVDVVPMGEGMGDYTMWKLDGEMFGGGMDMAPMIPAETPPHWLVYFQVENVDPTVEKIKELGGKVMLEPMPYPGGRLIVASDPHGVVFGALDASQPVS